MQAWTRRCTFGELANAWELPAWPTSASRAGHCVSDAQPTIGLVTSAVRLVGMPAGATCYLWRFRAAARRAAARSVQLAHVGIAGLAHEHESGRPLRL